MNKSFNNKSTSEANQDNLNCLTITSKSSLPQEKIKFAVEKNEKNYDHESMLKNKTLRNDNSNQRRSKHDQKGRDYLCCKCWKSYLSYAAMYVHLKKKHNITIDDLKSAYSKLIKRNKISPIELLKQVRLKKKYKNFEMNFDKLFQKAFKDIFLEGVGKYSDFITEENLNFINSSANNLISQDARVNLSINSSEHHFHPLFTKIKSIHATFINKELLETIKNSEMMKNFDDALSIYIFASWNFSSSEENLLNLKIALILREYLNFIGWDNLKIMAEYQIVDSSEIKYEDDFTKITLGNYLPELLDDFIGIYLKDGCPDFDSSFSEVKEFIADLCNILYNENLISYMIEPLEE